MTSRKSSKIYILSALSLAAFISFVWAKPIERDFYSQETHHFESETLAESDIEELSTLEVSDEVLQSLIKNAESPITPPAHMGRPHNIMNETLKLSKKEKKKIIK